MPCVNRVRLRRAFLPVSVGDSSRVPGMQSDLASVRGPAAGVVPTVWMPRFAADDRAITISYIVRLTLLGSGKTDL